MLLKGFSFFFLMAVRVLNIVCCCFGLLLVIIFLLPFENGWVGWLAHPLALRAIQREKAHTGWMSVCFSFKLYLFFVLFISVDVFLCIRWFLMWNNYSWYVDSLHSFKMRHVLNVFFCFTLLLPMTVLLPLLAAVPIYFLSIEWILVEKQNY